MNLDSFPFTFSSIQTAPRTDVATKLVDYWSPVRVGPLVLYSLFGYNAGAQQFLQLFDGEAISGTITDTVDLNQRLTLGADVLRTGQQIVVSGVASVTTGFVRRVSAGIIEVYDTRAVAVGPTTNQTGLQTVDAADDTGTWVLVPDHTFVIGAADNYSVIVPVSGIGFSLGLCVGTSSTAGTYTAAAAKSVTMLGTLKW